MNDFIIGIPIGIAIGIAIGIIIGIAIGKKRKTWEEMTTVEKRNMKIAILVGIVNILIGVILLIWQLSIKNLI